MSVRMKLHLVGNYDLDNYTITTMCGHRFYIGPTDDTVDVFNMRRWTNNKDDVTCQRVACTGRMKYD